LFGPSSAKKYCQRKMKGRDAAHGPPETCAREQVDEKCAKQPIVWVLGGEKEGGQKGEKGYSGRKPDRKVKKIKVLEHIGLRGSSEGNYGKQG